MEMKTCAGCGEKFKPVGPNGRRNSKKRYCNRQCWLTKYNAEDASHSIKGAFAAGSVNKQALRGTIRSSGKAYVKEDGRHQHRVVAERFLGRELHDGEVVHHEDRNPKNNDLSNLWVFKSRAAHTRHHGLKHIEEPDKCDCDVIRFKK